MNVTEQSSDIVRDRLTSTMFLAAMAHGIIVMGVSFAPDAFDDTGAPPTLEVALIAANPDDEEAPDDARYLAQQSQRGAGNTAEPVRAVGQPLLPTDSDSEELMEGHDARRADPGQLQRTSDMIVTRGRSGRRVQAVPDASDRPQLEATLAAAPVLQLSILMVDVEMEAPRATGEERELLVSLSSRESVIAEYMHAWKSKIERIGTVNFPDAARRRGLAGSPTLEVTISADGSLRQALVKQSSGHALLDRAALRILELAAPFEPFPSDLRERYDVLRFAYEWQFIGGELIDTRVRAGLPPG